MSNIIGIDLGTTNSVVSVMSAGQPKIIENEEGARTTPSVVAYTNSGERLVGQMARRQAITNPENTVYSVKRFMGSKFDDVSKEAKKMPYRVSKKVGGGGTCILRVNNKDYTPEEVSAQVLLKLKTAAENFLGHDVKEAVITVPAYFNDAQRQATKDAGQIAGLDVKRIINEPTAAALAYGIDQNKEQKVAVFDFGGGTFDISILDIDDNVVEVLSTNGDTHLGGDDVDNVLMDWLVGEFKSDTGVDVMNDPMVMQRLKDAAEKAKIELSSTSQTDINLPFLTADTTGPKHLQLKLTRSKFDQLIDDIVKRTLKPVRRALKDASLAAGDIDEVILVGGSTRIPAIRNAVEKFFKKTVNSTVNPDEVVAMGAAVQGGVLSGTVSDVLLLDVTPLSLGIETLGSVMTRLIERNTTVPTKKSETFSTAEDGQLSVDIHVLQGEREFARDNKTLGNFKLDGIPPAPRGTPQIEVTFDIDVDGIVHVSAKDKATGKEQSIKLEAGSGLSDSDIDRMVEEAETFKEEDQVRRKEIDDRNKLDSLVYQMKKNLEEFGDKLSDNIKADINMAVEKAEEALKGSSVDDINTAYDNLNSVSMKMGTELQEAMTAAQAQAQAATPQPDATVDGTEVVDAEVVDVEAAQ